MTMIKTGGVLPMIKVEEVDGQVSISSTTETYSPIAKAHARFGYIELNGASKVVIYDGLLETEYISKTNELTNNLDAVISNSGTDATDETAVSAYLSTFVGV